MGRKNLKKATDTATADSAPASAPSEPNAVHAPSTTLAPPPGPLALMIGDRKGLADILSTLAKVADAKSTMPILSHVLWRTDTDGTLLAATDLGMSAVYRAPAWIGGRGGRCVPAKQIADIVKRMPRSEIRVRGTEHGGMVLDSGKVETAIMGLADRDFPKVPNWDGLSWSALDVSAFLAVVAPTIGAVCQDETRFHLNGIYLETEAGILRAVATDGHRLHKAQAPASVRLDKGLIVPTKGVQILRRVLRPGACEIAFNAPHLFVRQGGWTFSIKCIDAQFPPYQQVIPSDHKRFITVNRDMFVNALERAKLYASDVRGVHLKIDAGDLMVIADNPDTGTTRERFPCEYSGGDFEIGANIRYLIEAIKVIDDDRVTFSCSSELDPMLVRGSEDMGTRALADSALVCVVMPMRI